MEMYPEFAILVDTGIQEIRDEIIKMYPLKVIITPIKTGGYEAHDQRGRWFARGTNLLEIKRKLNSDMQIITVAARDHHEGSDFFVEVDGFMDPVVALNRLLTPKVYSPRPTHLIRQIREHMHAAKKHTDKIEELINAYLTERNNI